MSNLTFVPDEPKEIATKEKTLKRKALAPPPPLSQQKETIEVQQQAVIAQLDEILDKEVAIAQLDDILNNETCRISDRKLSAGTLSNMSNVTSRVEDVVADVHRANVSTPIAVPKNPPFLNVYDTPSGRLDANSNTYIVDNNNDIVNVPENNNTSNSEVDKIEPALEDIDNPSLTDSNVNFDDKNAQNELKQESVGTADEPKEIASSATLNTSSVPSVESIEKESERNDGPADNATIPKAPDFNFNNDKAESSPKVSFAESTKAQDDNATVSSAVPTREALKSVTLRKVQKQIKEIEDDDNANARDDNLKVGSEEYKAFIKNLDNKLKRVTVIPSLYQVPRKDVIIKPKEVAPNENVIEEKINKEDAREKLKSFIESSVLGDGVPAREVQLGSPRRVLREEDRSKSVDESLLQKKSDKIEIGLDEIPENSNTGNNVEESDSTGEVKSVSLVASDFDIKGDMENVFHSIRLRRLETKDDQHLKRRLSRSLGSSFAKEDDKNEHKRKMGDIFKTIKSLPNKEPDDKNFG